MGEGKEKRDTRRLPRFENPGWIDRLNAHIQKETRYKGRGEKPKVQKQVFRVLSFT